MSLSIHKALQNFSAAVTAKTNQLTPGAPEDQVRGPFENFIADVAAAFQWHIVCTGETTLADHLGRPDYAVHVNQRLTGYVELKAPGVGVNAAHFRGHTRAQVARFSALPNLLYTDGNTWALYRNGERVGNIVRLAGDVATDGKRSVTREDAQAVADLLRDFLLWEPIIPTSSEGKIHLQRFAALLAPLCRVLRDAVTDALQHTDSPLVHIAEDWRRLLCPNASDAQFADAYAQMVTFALLLSRSEGADPLTLAEAVSCLGGQHNLLSRALQVLTDTAARVAIAAPIDLLVRVIAAVPPTIFADRETPWLYFYEDFLAAYDPDLRKDAGAYYTPVPIVHAQVRLIDDVLTRRFGKALGFAASDVVTLDPATGTGTYLLGVIEHALTRVEAVQGPGAVPGRATTLAKNLYGFELMVGPYAVAELRVSRALDDQGARLPEGGTRIYLTDTLENPHATPQQLPFYLKPIAEQHTKALQVKRDVPVIVCLGNPPYDRHVAASDLNQARTGGWVRWGDAGEGTHAILNAFIDPATVAGHGLHIKNLYNLYVYFWRWALWKVFEQATAPAQGVISFISASSYLDGDAFSGMREHMRRVCDMIWIIDLGGEGRGTRQDDNVFVIQTPVAIAVAVRDPETDEDEPARVYYTRIEGNRAEKLEALEAITALDSLTWQACPDDWQAPFRPAGEGPYFTWPLLTDLMPWQHSGVQLKRTWPIGPDVETLQRRWQGLLNAQDRGKAFRETRDRRIDRAYQVDFPVSSGTAPIADLAKDAPMPQARRYAYRSFDRQWVIADGRLMSRRRAVFWYTYSERQIFLTSLFSQPLGPGPALTACAAIPDLDHFRGSYGAKAAIPLYRTADAAQANLVPGVLDLLRKTYGRTVTPEDFLAYVYGLLAQPAFTRRFFEALETRELRVPMTKDSALFEEARHIGARLLWLHTYGARFVPPDETPGHVPPGSAKCIQPIPSDPDRYPESFEYNDTTKTIHIGAGAFAPVAPEVFEFEVSGLKVVQSWLNYRMKGGAGRKSSPLDDIGPESWSSQLTTELLELLWVLEQTIAGYPEQAHLLNAIVAGACFQIDELPTPPAPMRKPPKKPSDAGPLFDLAKGAMV